MGLPDTDMQIFQDPSNIKNADNKQKRSFMYIAEPHVKTPYSILSQKIKNTKKDWTLTFIKLQMGEDQKQFEVFSLHQKTIKVYIHLFQ